MTGSPISKDAKATAVYICECLEILLVSELRLSPWIIKVSAIVTVTRSSDEFAQFSASLFIPRALPYRVTDRRVTMSTCSVT